VTAVETEERSYPLRTLQPRDVDVQVHPIDPFDRHMLIDDLADSACYAHHRSG